MRLPLETFPGIDYVQSELAAVGIIPESRIIVELDEMTAVRKTLDMAKEGDLVVLLLGHAGMKVIEDFMHTYIAGRQ